MIAAASLFLLITSAFLSESYPVRAGHCMSGPVIGEESGGVHGRDGMGELADGGFLLSFGNELLTTDSNPLAFQAGRVHKISLEGSMFRGFLLRISGLNGENVQASLSVTDETVTQILPSTGAVTGIDSACEAGVTALSHTSPDTKDRIEAEFNLTEVATVLVEATVVTNNQGGGQNDWYYSSFEVDIVPQQEGGEGNTSGEGNSGEENTGDRGECSWWCDKIPTPWQSDDSSVYPKCDWMYSCSACDECQGPGDSS